MDDDLFYGISRILSASDVASFCATVAKDLSATPDDYVKFTDEYNRLYRERVAAFYKESK
jgi:hypothetical protein